MYKVGLILSRHVIQPVLQANNNLLYICKEKNKTKLLVIMLSSFVISRSKHCNLKWRRINTFK